MAPRRKKTAAGSVGLTAAEMGAGVPPSELATVERQIEAAGGRALVRYREPLAGQWVVLAALPIDRIAPTPYQRELSEAHVKRLSDVIPKVGRFLDPVIAVPADDGFWTPNGMHRLAALKALGAKAITALVVPERGVALRILALNTEKAHNLRDKSLEAMRMERALAAASTSASRPESTWAFELEEPAYVTIGLCYEQRPRFAGAVYLPVLKRCEEFMEAPIQEALEERLDRAKTVLDLDDAVVGCIEQLKEAGLRSPYLKNYVVARINPLRFIKAPKVGAKAPKASFDATFGKMIQKARALDVSKVRQQDIAVLGAGGPPEE